MTHFEEDLAGVCLAGEYTLRRRIADGDSGVLFEAARPSGEPVLVRLEADSSAAEERLALWRRSAYLQHPNLLRLLDCGRWEDSVYAVMEWPDDHLAAGLEQGPLGEAEARDLMLSLLDALRYLHAQGLVHGQVDAHHVWAAGNAIKLSTDNLREPEGAASPYAGDIGALGALVYRALTGHDFAGSASDVPEPFAAIVRNTAGAVPADRWRIPEIAAALGPPLEQAATAAAEEEPIVERALPAGRGSDVVLAVDDGEATVRERLRYEPRPAPPRLPVWAWPASLAVVIGCIVWVLHTPAPKPAANPPAPTYAPAAPEPAPAPPPTQPAAAPSAEPQERAVWRVIAYTYNAFRDAEKKALAINRKWPGFHAEVYAPKGETNPRYLVALGGRMNRMDAARLLQKARSRGLPRDTFILNFAD
jgi:serine/threonine protein kinase